MHDSRVAIITDSTCDLPQEMIDQYGIYVQPLRVIWGEEQLRDRIDIQPQEFYDRLAQGYPIPTSSQPSVLEFVELYQRAQAEGAEEIVTLTLSSGMSGTYQTALQAAQQVSLPVHVIDTKGPTMTLGWQVLAVARARLAGGNVQGMLAAAEKVRRSLVQFVCMDTVEYLRKGGRIGKAIGLLANMLDIKPIIQVNHDSGVVEPIAVARTHRKAVEVFYEKFFSRLDTSLPMRIAVLHGGVAEEAQQLAERITADFHPVEIIVNTTGPVLGIHTGPRALALAGYCEEAGGA